MAKVRTMANAIRKGAVGDSTYYYRNGEQIVRQRRNNSNYGATASRTESQMTNRVKWSNLVNVYKACKSWMPKAFESKKTNQTDYNRFMSVNRNSSRVALTKDMALNGCAVIDSYIISQGSITPIQINPYSGTTTVTNRTDIAVTLTLSSSTTVAQLAENIIANNPDFRDGDNLAFILFRQSVDSREYPYLTSEYFEITLDTTNTSAVSVNPIYSWLGVDGGFLGILDSAWEDMERGAFAFIHTRKVGGSLQVSTQTAAGYDSQFIALFSSRAAVQAAIDSYGVDEDVPLDPSFSHAVVRSVTANGSVVSDGDTFDDTFGLIVAGERFDLSNCKIYKDGVYFPPLASDSERHTYLVDTDGEYILYVNGRSELRFTVENISYPSDFTNTYSVGMTAQTGQPASSVSHTEVFESALGLYAHKKSSELPYFFVLTTLAESQETSSFNFENCSMKSRYWYSSSSRLGFVAEISDASKPAWIEFHGKILAIFNYDAY